MIDRTYFSVIQVGVILFKNERKMKLESRKVKGGSRGQCSILLLESGLRGLCYRGNLKATEKKFHTDAMGIV